MGKAIAPMTRAWALAVVFSVLMVLVTVAIVVLHAIMFSLTLTSPVAAAPGRDAPLYLWSGTGLAGLSAWAAVVLYQVPWQRLTPVRWVVIALGGIAAGVTLGLWLTFWAAR